MPDEQRGVADHLVVVDGELTVLLARVEERLLVPLARRPSPGGGRPGTDAVLSDPGGVLAAFRRVRLALAEAEARGPRVWAPNGRWEHAGLRLACPARTDLDLLYAALRELSAALVDPPGPPGAPGAAGADAAGLAEALAELAAAAGETGAGLVGGLARVLAAVDLVPDADTEELSRALRAAAYGDGGEERDVRLTDEEEDAWQRLAHRFTMVLTESQPLHRFL